MWLTPPVFRLHYATLKFSKWADCFLMPLGHIHSRELEASAASSPQHQAGGWPADSFLRLRASFWFYLLWLEKNGQVRKPWAFRKETPWKETLGEVDTGKPSLLSTQSWGQRRWQEDSRNLSYSTLIFNGHLNSPVSYANSRPFINEFLYQPVILIKLTYLLAMIGWRITTVTIIQEFSFIVSIVYCLCAM